VRLELPAAPLLVSLDSALVDKIAANLVENALKYSPPGSPVDLATWVQDGALTLAVADRGPGVAPAEVPRLFDKFYRAASSSNGAQGAGLGLAIARGFARAHGGDVQYAPRPGGGSVFTVHVPIDSAGERGA
jgi:two-component system sensor histidine kinase KdpD